MHTNKPIFIISAPRSGSTLLFETLMRHKQLWTFRDEGHGWIEKYPSLRPLRGGVESNRLTRQDLNPSLKEQLQQDLLSGMISAQGGRVNSDVGAIRVLEKTPKNCLRIPFIDAIYPDAQYIYLFRDPKESISSIIEGWRHQRFVTYGDVRMVHGKWCFLRPPGWKEMINRPLHEIAAFQWRSCQDIILDDLSNISPTRWTFCSFDELVGNTGALINRLQEFSELNLDPALESYCASSLPHSRYTQTPPQSGKWKRNYAEIGEIFPSLETTISRLNSMLPAACKLDTTMPSIETHNAVSAKSAITTGRNELCPCDSGLKYKKCHGKLT